MNKLAMKLQRHALSWLWFYKATFQLTDSSAHRSFTDCWKKLQLHSKKCKAEVQEMVWVHPCP
jgi:hypothetical protein